MAAAAVRWGTLVAAGIALVWSVYCLPIFLNQSPIETVAKHVIAHEVFRGDTLKSFEADSGKKLSGKWQRPSASAAQATIDVRLLEQSIRTGDTKKVDANFQRTDDTIRMSLADSPANGFLWAVLFWVENNRNGFRQSNLRYLERSYQTGPNEGWFASTRNRFALAIYPSLTPELANDAMTEFSHLVASGFFNETIKLAGSVRPALAAKLLQSLKDIDPDRREAFAKAAYRQGYNWDVPGVNKPEWRPWH